MIDNQFLGLNNFVWWFGVVENRLDPLKLGRCQVRCFGWHNDDINQIPIASLPWAHPIVPYGMSAAQAPAEGTMVFGFFADGKEGQYPIILGSVPGIPEEIREYNSGFTDPYTDEQKALYDFPRKIKEVVMRTNGQGIQVTEDTPKRNPSRLNEPTVSRLARPTRGVDSSGLYSGIVPDSIADTTIAIQRKTRVANVISANNNIWDEPYPSFNAMYPYNNVTETESGHAFEIDDTPDFERVQLSHRTGSTLEFLPEGHVKIKSQKSRYDVTMGNQNEYVNGSKHETIQSDMYLRVNGKLVIQCKGLEIASTGDVDIKGQSVRISATADLNLTGSEVNMAGLNTNIFATNDAKMHGGVNAYLSSTRQVTTSGLYNLMEGQQVSLKGILYSTEFGVHDLLTPIPIQLKVPKSIAKPAKGTKNSFAGDLKPNSPYAARFPKTDKYSNIAQTRETPNTATTVTNGTTPTIPPLEGGVTTIYDNLTGNIETKIKIPEAETTGDQANPIAVGTPTTVDGTFESPAFTDAEKLTNIG